MICQHNLIDTLRVPESVASAELALTSNLTVEKSGSVQALFRLTPIERLGKGDSKVAASIGLERPYDAQTPLGGINLAVVPRTLPQGWGTLSPQRRMRVRPGRDDPESPNPIEMKEV